MTNIPLRTLQESLLIEAEAYGVSETDLNKLVQDVAGYPSVLDIATVERGPELFAALRARTGRE